MVCSEKDDASNIKIPIVMIPKSEGEDLKNSMAGGSKGAFENYKLLSNFISFRIWI